MNGAKMLEALKLAQDLKADSYPIVAGVCIGLLASDALSDSQQVAALGMLGAMAIVVPENIRNVIMEITDRLGIKTTEEVQQAAKKIIDQATAETVRGKH